MGLKRPPNSRTARVACEKIARTVTIRRPFQLDVFLRDFGDARGKPVVFLPFPLPHGAPSGLTFSLDDVDIVVVTDTVSRPHQCHIVFHEIAHLLLGHKRGITQLGGLFAGLNLDVLKDRLVHARTADYTEPEEFEAETLASALTRRARLWDARPATPPPADPLIRRMSAAFEHGRDQ